MIGQMTKTLRRELEESGVSEPEILEDWPSYLPGLQRIGRTVFQHWAKVAAEPVEATSD
jgi:hypothetical protein